MYIYSLLALVLAALLAKHIRTHSPFHVLALAWLFIIDTIVNGAFTVVFILSWFSVLAAHASQNAGGTPGAGSTMNETAGFTSPEHNVSHVGIVATSPLDAAAITLVNVSGAAAGADTIPGAPALTHGIMQPEGITSAIVVLLLWLTRLYLMFVVMSFAREVLSRHMLWLHKYSLLNGSDDSDGHAKTPFDECYAAGQGWRGKLGRLMVNIGSTYWLGKDGEESVEKPGSRWSRKDTEGYESVRQRRIEGRSSPVPESVLEEVAARAQRGHAGTEATEVLWDNRGLP